jgi:hypothetical protein
MSANFRTMSDAALKAELERLLAKRRAEVDARLARFAKLSQPIPESHETPWIIAMFAIACFLLAARLMGLLP